MTIPQSGCRYAPPCQRLAAITVFTWRFCGFPKGTLRKVASLALLTRSPLGLLPPLPKGGRLASGKPRGDFALVLLANGKENPLARSPLAPLASLAKGGIARLVGQGGIFVLARLTSARTTGVRCAMKCLVRLSTREPILWKNFSKIINVSSKVPRSKVQRAGASVKNFTRNNFLQKQVLKYLRRNKARRNLLSPLSLVTTYRKYHGGRFLLQQKDFA